MEKKAKKWPPDGPVTLHVKHLTKKVTQKLLIEVFSSFGKVYSARIIPMPDNDDYNYGFVEIEPSGVGKALRSVTKIYDRRLIISKAKTSPKPRKPKKEEE